MVYATPTTNNGGGHGRGEFYTRPRHYLEPQQQQGTQRVMSIPEMIVSVKIAGSEADVALEDVTKIRKPYTITKTRESWTKEEHDKFLLAIQRFDRDWKKIEGFVGSKTAIQIRSHAQKYFLKVQKNGTTEHVPPPRLKRKAAHPYPQKASKNAQNMSQSTTTHQSTSSLLEPRSLQPIIASQLRTDYSGLEGTMMSNNYYRSSIGIPPCTWKNCETADQVHQAPALSAMPDFAQIYSFVGNVFDPSTSGHLLKLKEMNPIDVETVLLLMRNLSINLASPDFEDHRRLLFFI